MDQNENLLQEINEAFRIAISKKLDATFRRNGYIIDPTRYIQDIRFTISILLKGARLKFSIWSPVQPSRRQEAFQIIEDFLGKEYGITLTNQRLYTYQIKMEFGNDDNLVDPLQVYTLMKINQTL